MLKDGELVDQRVEDLLHRRPDQSDLIGGLLEEFPEGGRKFHQRTLRRVAQGRSVPARGPRRAAPRATTTSRRGERGSDRRKREVRDRLRRARRWREEFPTKRPSESSADGRAVPPGGCGTFRPTPAAIPAGPRNPVQTSVRPSPVMPIRCFGIWSSRTPVTDHAGPARDAPMRRPPVSSPGALRYRRAGGRPRART